MLLIVLAVLLFFPAPASAHTARPHVPIDLHFGTCPGNEDPRILGCSYQSPLGVFHVYVNDHDHLTLAHELAHVYDVTELTEQNRADFKAIFGRQGESWWQGRNPPGEFFAEAYSRCEEHTPWGSPTSYGYAPARWQHRAVCRLIWEADSERGT